MFKIVDVKKGETKISKMESPYFLIEVYFTTDDGDASFGYLGKYHSAVMVEDTKKYEDFYNDPKNLEWEFEGDEEQEFKTVKFNKPSAYDLGLCKQVKVIGRESIMKEEDGTWSYKQYVNANYITEGAAKQLLEMKEHQDRGYCRYGDYPSQVGAFRSGDPYHDFIGILEVFDRFWD